MAKRARSADVENEEDEPKSKKLDPIIEGLIARMPPAGTDWPEPERRTWLQLMEQACKVIYKDPLAHPPQQQRQVPIQPARPPGT